MYKTIDEIPADLRWLAENVHEWPKFSADHGKIDGYLRFRIGSEEEVLVQSKDTYDCYRITDWQAARDLISGKPGWDEAPEGYNWLWQNRDGGWMFGKGSKPSQESTYYLTNYHSGEFPGRVLGDWRNTLEHRPTDHTNELLDGDAPVITATDFKANRLEDALRDEVNTTTQALRVNHEDGFIDVERLIGGGVMLTDQDGQEIQIKSKAVLEAIADAAYSLM